MVGAVQEKPERTLGAAFFAVLCGVGVFKAITAGFDHPWKMLFWGASAFGAAIHTFKARNAANRNLTDK